jgi:putative dimethyl sulfoxide reductase chaperone
MAEQVLDLVDGGAATRANAYYALARAVGLPSDWESDTPEVLREAFEAMGAPLSALGMRLAAEAEAILEDPEAATVAHTKLFLGPFEILAAPWASYYLEDEPLLMGATSQYAAMAYANAGLAPSGVLKDAPDHISHELEFMYYLAFGMAQTGDSVWHERQVEFWRQHLGRWLPPLADVIEKAEVHPFYDTLSETLLAFARSEDASLGSP